MDVPAHHPLARQPVELRGGDPAARVEAGHVAVAHVIDQKVDDVRFVHRLPAAPERPGDALKIVAGEE